MVQNGEISLPDTDTKNGIVRFFSNQPDFNIRTTSVKQAFTATNAFDGIAATVVPVVKAEMEVLQRVQALTATPGAIPHLLDGGIKSALDVSNLSWTQIQANLADKLGLETVSSIHSHALNARFIQENRLTAIHQHIQGTGLKAIDGTTSQQDRADKIQGFLTDSQVNLTSLFGSVDYCTCSDCNSILSPAAYLVELLNFLRNNNLDPGKTRQSTTLYEAFCRRRPDIPRLKLSCENTNTVLPYIDLANEIMESFVVHLDQYAQDKNTPKQVSLDVFDTFAKDRSALLLATPQNVNYQAYAAVTKSAYPFSLPYNRGIDEIRVYLNWLGSSRTELIDVFRSDCVLVPGVDTDAMVAHHHQVIDRARDAEFLSILAQEYKIVFKEAFWPKEYFELTTGKSMTETEYQTRIGVQPPYVYWGYKSEDQLMDLANVSDELLPRSGISYADLVDLVGTSFLNPYKPQGWALEILGSVRSIYVYLTTLIDSEATDPARRFALVIGYLNTKMPLGPIYDSYKKSAASSAAAKVSTNLGSGNHTADNSVTFCTCGFCSDYRFWVEKYFEQVGNLIVLDIGATLSIQGYVQWVGASSTAPLSPSKQQIGRLYPDGSIKDFQSNTLGQVNKDSSVTFNPPPASQPKSPDYTDYNIQIVSLDGTSVIAYAMGSSKKLGTLLVLRNPVSHPIAQAIKPLPATSPISWSVNDTSDISTVTLVHLNGTPLTVIEYDRIMQFMRLRNRLGWKIDELDKTLSDLGRSPLPAEPAPTSGDIHDATFHDIRDPDEVEICPIHGSSEPPTPAVIEIKSTFVEQVVAVQNLLKITNLPLTKLLTFWADIPTTGENSLYANLFLQPDILGMDPVFQADDNGDYLQQSGMKISDHYPAIQAAMQIPAASDLIGIINYKKLTDELVLSNLSTIYRHVVLSSCLKIPIRTLLDVAKTFLDPFVSAKATYKCLTFWNEITNSGYTLNQLGYILQGINDPQKPLSPTRETVLTISNTLYHGIIAINDAHPDIPPPTTTPSSPSTQSSTSSGNNASTDSQSTLAPEPTLNSLLVSAELALIFDAATVASIVALLEGTTVYTCTVTLQKPPPIPDTLTKVHYISQAPGALQVTGILTDDELAKLRNVSKEEAWTDAVNKIVPKPRTFFDTTLSGIFNQTLPDVDAGEARKSILSGDVAAAGK